MSSKFTKSEWTIETPCGFPYSGLYVVPIVRKDFPYHIAKIRQLREREESEANACLIAAAPDLYDACKELLELADNGSAAFDDPLPDSPYLKAKAALKKADG